MEFFKTGLMALSISAASLASAMDESPVKSVYFSPGCGDVEYDTTSSGKGETPDGYRVDRESLELYFNNFNVFADRPTNESADCYMEVKVKVPAGKQFRATSAISEGVYDISDSSKGTYFIDYTVLPGQSYGKCEKNFHGTGDFQLQADLNDRSFTECAPHDRVITLVTNIRAAIQQRDHEPSSLVLDEVQERIAVKWNWNWRMCVDQGYFHKPFNAYRKETFGRNYAADLVFYGSTGKIVADDETGTLSDVTYSRDGKVAKGRWSLGHESGTFRLEIVDTRTGQFIGTWGDHRGERGIWRGAWL